MLDIDHTTTFEVDVGPSRLVYGTSTITRLGGLAATLGRRALVVTDPGLLASGHIEAALASLHDAAVETAVFSGVDPNPGESHVAAGAAAAKDHAADILVAIGGGSAMDCAKGTNFIVSNGGRMADYWGHDKATRPMLPSIGVPTTAGTGSEAQSYALISQDVTHRKMACGDRKARFAIVLLDPNLLATVPRGVAAVTGLDALSHAVESYVSTRRNPVSTMYAHAAFSLLESSFEAMLDTTPSAAVRGRMLLGSYLAGAAIEASMLGAAHACANPLTSRYNVEHGVAVALMLPSVVRFNGEVVASLYGELTAGRNAEELACRIEDLRATGGLAKQLRELGIERSDLDQLAVDASQQWTCGFNPRPVGVDELRSLYETAW